LDFLMVSTAVPNPKPQVAVVAWLPDGMFPRLQETFPQLEFHDAREPAALDQLFRHAAITYGLPPLARLVEAPALRWIQLTSAGVPQELCPAARQRGVTVTNLAGLYGPTIAEHALALMTVLARNLHIVLRNQQQRRWDRTVAGTMADLHGRTLALVGLGNIGQAIARLARAYGMQVIGCRRTGRFTPYVDRVYPLAQLHDMLTQADYVAVAAPLTAQTEGMLGPAEFAAMKPGVIYINVSRGAVAQEQALLAALQSGHVAAAGLDVYATEPLGTDHPFWELPQVLVSPHYSGDTVNNSPLPAERFARNLRAWLTGRQLEGMVNLELGY
jgi:phosphoglycerate dehydrogenase-like enzyme